MVVYNLYNIPTDQLIRIWYDICSAWDWSGPTLQFHRAEGEIENMIILLLAIVAIILQIILVIVSFAAALFAAIPFGFILVVIMVIDLVNGEPATTHDALQLVGGIIQSVAQFIGNIHFT